GYQAVRVRRDRIGAPELLEPFRTHLIMAHEMDEMAVESKRGGQETIAETSRAVHDRIEDGLSVRRRARDHLEDLAGRRLLIEPLGHLGVGRRERPILLLQFLEEADVLDGDDGLVREGLDERDLSL